MGCVFLHPPTAEVMACQLTKWAHMKLSFIHTWVEKQVSPQIGTWYKVQRSNRALHNIQRSPKRSPKIWKFQASQKGPKMDIPKGRMDPFLGRFASGHRDIRTISPPTVPQNVASKASCTSETPKKKPLNVIDCWPIEKFTIVGCFPESTAWQWQCGRLLYQSCFRCFPDLSITMFSNA